MDVDTIAAIATPTGKGGIGIIRISGVQATDVVRQLFSASLKPRYASYGKISSSSGQHIDDGLVLFFPAPHSFTGEDVVEIQGHGGVIISDMILQAVIEAGARMARPGEFSQRAFLNGKMDLAQAESVADLINASSRQAARAALRTLEGQFSRQIHTLVESLIQLRLYVESSMDFVDEEIELLESGDVYKRLQMIRQQLRVVFEQASRGRMLNEGLNIVILGKPNAGKSSLMNALSGQDSAIVTQYPGTTRDIIQERLLICGVPVHICDTAGIREQAEHIEQEGMRRALSAANKADRILWVHDDTHALDDEDIPVIDEVPVTLVYNKTDQSGRRPGAMISDRHQAVAISTLTGAGMTALEHHIVGQIEEQESSENEYATRRRHIQALEMAQGFLQQADIQLRLSGGSELLAEELKGAQQALSEITGDFTQDDLLGRIFSEFCIGK